MMPNQTPLAKSQSKILQIIQGAIPSWFEASFRTGNPLLVRKGTGNSKQSSGLELLPCASFSLAQRLSVRLHVNVFTRLTLKQRTRSPNSHIKQLLNGAGSILTRFQRKQHPLARSTHFAGNAHHGLIVNNASGDKVQNSLVIKAIKPLGNFLTTNRGVISSVVKGMGNPTN